MIDVSGAINYFCNTTLTHIIFDGTQSYDKDGLLVQATQQTATFSGVIQPADGSMIKDMPEGVREEAKFFIDTTYTQTKVNDEVLKSDGIRYRVVFVRPSTSSSYQRIFLALLASC